MKEQLTKVKNGRLKNFGYGSILTAFALEKIPLMQLQYVSLGLPPPIEPRMQRWVNLMARHAGQSQVSFFDTFFEWFNHQEMVFSEYPYAGMDFRGDPDLVKNRQNFHKKLCTNFPPCAHRTPSSVLGGMHPCWLMAKLECITPFDLERVRWSQGEFFKPQRLRKTRKHA